MDAKTKNALARIAVEWHKSTSSRVGDSSRRRASNGSDSSAMSPIALRHRRYQQLIRLRKAG
jgi:hypothetical protein